MKNFFKLENYNDDIPGGRQLPPAPSRDYKIGVAFSARKADLRPLPLMDSMCPVWICTGAGCGQLQVG
ncbi:MAG: hypothetical protein A2144_13915 [Chloroflexi bacterium RBG_16_50_9]|nr:MAG: hypothetical protein A2144_13915 [Chloroflexi bacterium RBG_16_50_9]